MQKINLDECRKILPLPHLMSRLGLGDAAKAKAHCPFHEDETPSFSIRQLDAGRRWQWRCWAGCGHGDEVTLIEKVTGKNTSEAIKEYGKLAGMTAGQFTSEAASIFNAQAAVVKPTKSPKALSKTPPVQQFKPLGLKGVAQVNKWRGLKSGIINELNEPGLIGMYGNSIAFAAFGGYHVRKKDGSWWYTKGCKATLFVLGEIEEGANVHVFESPWDAIAFADVSGERNNIVATRGAANFKLVVNRFREHTGSLTLWPQNDVPGQEWASNLKELFAGHIEAGRRFKIAPVPSEFKDLNDWVKGGGDAGDLMFAMTVMSKEFPMPQNGSNVPVSEPTSPVKPPPEGQLPGASAAKKNTHRVVDLQAPQSSGKPISSDNGEGAAAPHESVAKTEGDTNPPCLVAPGMEGLSLFENNFPVPVLAEPSASCLTSAGPNAGGEARESTAPHRQDTSGSGDSRGGEFTSVATTAEPPSEQLRSDDVEEVATGTVALSDEQSVTPEELPVQPPTSEVAALAQALDDTVEYLERFIKFPMREQANVVALWVAHTHVYKAWEYTPYLHILSPEKNCGKTNLLKVLQQICANPLKFESSSTAAFFHKVDELHPTLLWDEVDNLFKNEKDNRELIGLLNGGYERGAKAMRCRDGGAGVDEYDAYCPKAFTGIGTIPDTIHSRSIDIKLVRQMSRDKAEKVRSKYLKPVAQPIREAFSAWSKACVESIGNAAVSFPPSIDDGRKEDITEPLLAIADQAGGDWPGRARRSLTKVLEGADDMSIGIRLLEDIRGIFEATGLDRITTIGLLNLLIKIEGADSKWPAMWERDIRDSAYQRPAQKLAEMLAPYEIKPMLIRVTSNDEEARARGYHKAHFHDAWARYLEPAGELKTAELNL